VITQMILAIVIGAAIVVAAVAYITRIRKNKEPIQLGAGRKLER
jgi:multisubunit Na+/H+ antiporter MnhC subunit